MEDDGETNLPNWPIVLCDEMMLLTANELVWPATDFDRIPSEIRLILRQGLALFEQKASTCNGSTNSKCPQLHVSLENILFTPASDIDASLNNSSLLAKKQLEKMRNLYPDRVVSPQQAAFLFMNNFQTSQKLGGQIVDCMIRLFRWAMAEGRHDMISHVLVRENGEGFRMCPIKSCYIGIAFGSATYTRITEALLLQKPEIHGNKRNIPQFVHGVYLTPEMKNDKNSLKKHRSFLEKCGAQRGISLVLKSRTLYLKEFKYVASKNSGDKILMYYDSQVEYKCLTTFR